MARIFCECLLFEAAPRLRFPKRTSRPRYDLATNQPLSLPYNPQTSRSLQYIDAFIIHIEMNTQTAKYSAGDAVHSMVRETILETPPGSNR